MADNVNTAIYDTRVDRAAMLRLFERRVQGKVELVLNGHAVRTDELIRAANQSNKGFLALREAIDEDLRNTYREVYQVSSKSLIDLVGDQVSYTYQVLDNAIGKLWRTERPGRRVAEELVLNKPLHANTTLAQGWSNISVGERRRLENIIRKGIADGSSVEDIALMVRRGNVHKISLRQSQALVITSITSVTAQADHEVYTANKDSLTGWQYVAVLDSRTTDICAHRDGTIYPIEDTEHLPPAHFHCRSTTIPIVKSWDDLDKLEGVAQVRRRNLSGLSAKQKAYYDGQTPLKESYDQWLRRQPTEVQLRHLGDTQKLEIFRSGQLTLDKFTNAEGNSVGIRELSAMTIPTVSGDTRRFALAKEKLDTIKVGASTPDDFIGDTDLTKALSEYYVLQAGELNGTLSLTNYRGALLHNKKATKARVLSTLPTEANTRFNPITGRYEDTRIYQPSPITLENTQRLVRESEDLLPRDKEFITNFIDSLESKISVNERAVISENLRILFTRYRKNGEVWTNFKAVAQSQIKFDIANVSDYIETQIRKDAHLLPKLLQDNYIDPVLGPVQLDDLSKNFIKNIKAKNKWEDAVAPKIAKELRGFLDLNIPIKIRSRLNDNSLQEFYLKFAHRLALADSPDRDQLAVALGRDLYNLANYRGSRNEWFNLGIKILEKAEKKGFYKLETFGTQKRRLKSRLGGNYFGPYYDTFAVNLRITDPRIQEYSRLTRSVELGLRVAVTDAKNRLVFRKGYKTYWIDRGILGYEDTRIPITSTGSFGDFPTDLIDDDLVDALDWASKAEYKVDPDFYDFATKLLKFEDDKGRAKYYHGLNQYRAHLLERGDSYERLKALEWLRNSGKSFSNHPFLDHRARIYDRGLIGPQSGETFRPFLSTAEAKNFSAEDFFNLQDQIGSFLGGLNDYFEGFNNSLSILGRQKIAEKWRKDLVEIGNHIRRGKPNDIRAVLESNLLSRIDGEDQGKALRLALEVSKIDEFLQGNYSKANLVKLKEYRTSLALEQDASSSGAQIIALTTKNKQLAELSNVVPTNYKRRLYDEIAASTFRDPRFIKLNQKLGLTEKDLRKAAKAQNLVTFYGAGERTGIINVEAKLSKALGKNEGLLVVKASDRDTVLSEIAARAARYEKFDKETYLELKALRQDVKEIFNKGITPGDDIIEQLYFLDPKTRELVEKLTKQYDTVVTPDDFKEIAQIFSENLRVQVPILRDFTRFFGRLAEDFLSNAKPSQSDFDWPALIKTQIRGTRKSGYRLPKAISRILGLKDEPLSEKFLKRIPGWNPDGTLSELLYGIRAPEARRTGTTLFGISPLQLKTLGELEVFTPNKLPKNWPNVPWVNFDGKIIEQNFTQVFEEKLVYLDKDGHRVINILQVPQKTDPTFWEELINKSGKINDIADVNKARTAFAVNGEI